MFICRKPVPKKVLDKNKKGEEGKRTDPSRETIRTTNRILTGDKAKEVQDYTKEERRSHFSTRQSSWKSSHERTDKIRQGRRGPFMRILGKAQKKGWVPRGLANTNATP